MFIESLTPAQLSQLFELLLLTAFLGGFAGANLGGFFELVFRVFSWGSKKLFGSQKTKLDLVRDLQSERFYLLMRARTAKREMRKLQSRQF